MSSPDIQIDQLPDKIRLNPIYRLGSKKFTVMIEYLSGPELSQALDLHTVLLGKGNNNLVRGTICTIGMALLYRLGPQHEILQFFEGVHIVSGAILGTLGVYQRSACLDGINILQRKINALGG